MKSRPESPQGTQRARAAIALIGLTMALNAFAAPLPPLAPAISDGNYTVTAQGCDSSGGTSYCAAEWVEERVEPQGTWQIVDGSFTNKPAGTYSYRSAAAYCDYWYPICSTSYSSAVSVLVTTGDIPMPEPLDIQLSYDYSVRFGNVVGDAGTDLLIERTSGPAEGNGVVDAIILEQIGAGAFRAVVPDNSQRDSSIWQPGTLSVSVEDMNADGYVDLALQNVASIVPGAEDQIVFASASAHDPKPKGVRAFDATLSEFATNLIDYMANEQYFIEHASWRLYTYFFRFSYCPSGRNIDGSNMAEMLRCSSMIFSHFDLVPNYSAFDQDAVAIWQDEVAVTAGDLTSGQAADRILDRIEAVFDVGIGGWDMREIFGEDSGIEDPVERRGLEGFLAILGIGNARADEVEPEEAPTQGPRANDVIHIVGRYIFGSSVNKMHTALLYKAAGTGIPTWFSAFDSDERGLIDGTLVARTNDPADSPLLMRMTVGEAVPPGAQDRLSYFFAGMQSAHEHYKNLPLSGQVRYDAIPEIPCGGCNGRNSNGYVNGLILATNGQARARSGFNFDGLTGWEYPVEAHYFGR